MDLESEDCHINIRHTCIVKSSCLTIVWASVELETNPINPEDKYLYLLQEINEGIGGLFQLKIAEIVFKMFRQTHPVYGLLPIDE